MNTEQHLKQYLESRTVTSEFEAALDKPSIRRAIYRFIVGGSIHPFRPLLLRLLDKEIEFRNDLWEGKVEDEEDFFESVYHCAFLLSRCGNPADTTAIWKVQYLNQDVGEIDVGNFVGAGVSATLSFLDEAANETSQEIARYIRNSLSDAKALEWLKDWEKRCRENLRVA